MDSILRVTNLGDKFVFCLNGITLGDKYAFCRMGSTLGEKRAFCPQSYYFGGYVCFLS